MTIHAMNCPSTYDNFVLQYVRLHVVGHLNVLHAGLFYMNLCHLLIFFFKIKYFEKIIHDCHLRV